MHDAGYFLDKITGDGKWFLMFSGEWASGFIAFCEVALNAVASDTTIPPALLEGAMDDEYRRLMAMLDAAMNFEKDGG